MSRKDAARLIKDVAENSAAWEAGIRPGDLLCLVNGEKIEDIFDYQYECADSEIEFTVRHKNGRTSKYLIEKTEDEDPGLIFDDGIMDDYKRCRNRCIFCFIDQMPEGMRETLYFKDDDSRLSFLQGNYVTLTNMSDHDIDRIIKYNLEPVNISFQTTNPELRNEMMGNRFAGEALKKADRLFEAGVRMNGQIVLCRGINDGKELDRTISDLISYIPCLESVSVVPVGLSRYREGLYRLEPFNTADCRALIEQVEGWQDRIYKEYGTHFIHASDEWYLNAGMGDADIRIPESDRYDGYLQLENGVGMVRLLIDEVEEGLKELEKNERKGSFSIVTGCLAFPVIKMLVERIQPLFPNMNVKIYPVRNDFFGETITVSGLLTGQDIRAQLKDKALGDRLYLPENLLRAGTDVLLDDMTAGELSDALQVPIGIVKSDGASFIGMFRGTE